MLSGVVTCYCVCNSGGHAEWNPTACMHGVFSATPQWVNPKQLSETMSAYAVGCTMRSLVSNGPMPEQQAMPCCMMHP